MRVVNCQASFFEGAILCMVLALCSSGRGQVMASSTFDGDSEGWVSSTAPGDITWTSTGGNPDGYLRFVDPGAPLTRAIAPSPFLGDWSSLNGVGVLQFDRKVFQNTNCPFSPAAINISGPTDSASWTGPLATREWTRVTASISEASWTVTGDWDRLLANVTRLELTIELVDNAGPCLNDEITGIDNVLLLPCADGTGQANSSAATLLVNGVGVAGNGPFPVTLQSGGQLQLDWSGPADQLFMLYWSPSTCPRFLDLGCSGFVDLNLAAGADIALSSPLFALNIGGTAQQVFNLPNLAPGPVLSLQGLVMQPAGVCPIDFIVTAAFDVSIE